VALAEAVDDDEVRQLGDQRRERRRRVSGGERPKLSSTMTCLTRPLSRSTNSTSALCASGPPSGLLGLMITSVSGA
jgi:hypothetical protein